MILPRYAQPWATDTRGDAVNVPVIMLAADRSVRVLQEGLGIVVFCGCLGWLLVIFRWFLPAFSVFLGCSCRAFGFLGKKVVNWRVLGVFWVFFG